ncbi:hypothetical protein [Sporomusa termitida]|uniref:Uncharacterized protein n=1 Tax=Sporomusa termitida TaxID=2377 RepID=A0A517DRN7_9FIRM|nr:hypothetical protein [Sporomusa termitida]QDR80025.1 hypothetical protein SPTER_13380 [Sporomusa termitida]
MTDHNKLLYFLTGLFLLSMIAIIVALAVQERYEFAQNITVKTCLLTVLTWLEVKYTVKIPHTIRILVLTAILSDSFFGLYMNLYTTSAIFDKLQHVFGSYTFSLFFYNLICQLTQPAISRTFSFIFVISLGLSIGVFYEIGEFIGDLTIKPSVPSQPSLLDTNLDLIADVIGAFIAAVHLIIVLQINDNRFDKK